MQIAIAIVGGLAIASFLVAFTGVEVDNSGHFVLFGILFTLVLFVLALVK